MFQAMRGGQTSGSNGGQTGQQPARNPNMSSRQPGSGMSRMGGSQAGGRRQDMGRVWYEDDSGELKMAFFRMGVTDNIYTEVVSGDIAEGLEVITGQAASTSSNSRNNNPMRMMRFMR